MIIAIFLVLVGFALLIKGADWMVTGASALAKKNNISDLAIGLTIVAFGTSAPELVVNGIASYQGHSDIIFGNVIGSNNYNLFLILGIAGLIVPVTVQKSTVWKEIPLSFLAIVLVFVFANDFFCSGSSVLSRIEGGILFTLFLGFLFYVYKQSKSNNIDAVTSASSELLLSMSNLKIWTLIIIGLSGLVMGGHFVVENAIEIAKTLGVSEKIIGLTIVAAGTSLPELVTSVVAALKKNSDIAIGNVIGSNIFNIFLVLSISSFVSPIAYNSDFNTDLYILAGGTIFLFLAMFLGKKKKLDRWEAAILFLAFVIYTIFQIRKEL